MAKTNSQSNGSTFIEVILYVAMSSVVLSLTTGFFLQTLELEAKSKAINEVEEQGRLSMQYMLQTIRSSTGVTAPASGQTDSVLRLLIQNFRNPSVFQVSNTNQLTISEIGGPSVPITSSKVNISGLSFTNIDAQDIVKVQFTIDYKNPDNRNSMSYSQSFYGSAELRRQ